jgi:predicted secreted protein
MSITRRAVSSVAAALALTLLGVALGVCDAPEAFASTTQGQTDLYLKAIESPFSVGEDQEITVGEGKDGTFELTSDIDYTGDSDLEYVWEISTDGGKTWTRIDNDTPTLKQTNMPPGNYLYRVTVTDANNNSVSQVFSVTVPESSLARSSAATVVDASPSTSAVTTVSNTNPTQAIDNTNDVSVQTGDDASSICITLACAGVATIVLLILAAYKRRILKSTNVKNSEA